MSVAAASAVQADVVQLKDRTIDLDPHLQGFPYNNIYIDLRGSKIFYQRRGKTDELMMLTYDPASRSKVDLSKGSVISPRDFAKRNLWGAAWSPVTKSIIIQADEQNDEIVNLYSLDPKTGVEKRLTNTAYIYGWRLSDDARRVAYVTRATKDEMSPSEVHVLDLGSGQDRTLYTDTPARKIVWTDVAWQPNGRGVLLSFNANGDRRRKNLLYVPFDTKAGPRVLTDSNARRYTVRPLEKWLGNDEFLYTSDEAGVVSVYRGSLTEGAPPVRVTAAGDNVKDAALLADGKRRTLVAIIGDPLKSTITTVDPRTGAVLEKETRDGQWTMDMSIDKRVILHGTSLSVPLADIELRLKGRGFERFERLAYPDDLLTTIIQCDVEKVSFPTFDKLSAPGEQGTLHAYLLKPKRPTAVPDRRALVVAFYGGDNKFLRNFGILCDAGYYVMSPAPRGTSDFGSDFLDLAAGDWGGAETLDDFAAGKYLRDQLAIPAQRIGIMGHSRGGYDTMRAMTFPGTVNGVKEDFRFGFGISGSGISNIIRAAKDGNISQWYANLTGGDPSKDPAKWNDRSPEVHANMLSGPILLTHGSKDNRVPVTESRAMHSTLKKLGKPSHYLELEGQGHAYVGIEAQTRFWHAVFEFLDGLR
ncbi:MAG: prolyl oligopeptidase family serine peptidase [Myxococcales bacterium]